MTFKQLSCFKNQNILDYNKPDAERTEKEVMLRFETRKRSEVFTLGCLRALASEVIGREEKDVVHTEAQSTQRKRYYLCFISEEEAPAPTLRSLCALATKGSGHEKDYLTQRRRERRETDILLLKTA